MTLQIGKNRTEVGKEMGFKDTFKKQTIIYWRKETVHRKKYILSFLVRVILLWKSVLKFLKFIHIKHK